MIRKAVVTLVLVVSLAVPAGASAQVPVCAKLTTSKLASQKNRVAYLTKQLPAARHAGYGIGPLLTLSVRALKAGKRADFARYFTLLQKACARR